MSLNHWMWSVTGSSFLYLTAVRLVIFISCTPAKKYLWNFFSRSVHVMIEFAGKGENKAKADSDSESGNRRILRASTAEASPHWIRNHLICLILVIPSCPENLVKSGTL